MRGHYAMKRLIVTALFLVAMVGWSGCFAAQTDMDFTAGFHYDWWDNDNDDRGMQLSVPIEVESAYRDISIELLGAYVYTSVDLSGQSARSLSDFVDTKLNFSYEILDRFPVDILLGLGLNLPTGHTDLKQRDLILITIPELVSITTFGEGFNVNPVISLTKQWDAWVAGIGLGYLWRGEYDYSTGVENYDPGEALTLTAELGYEISPSWYARAFGEYITYDEDEVDGEKFYQEGDILLFGLGAEYAGTDWAMVFSIHSIFRDKSKFRQGTILPSEEHNSHGDEWIGEVAYLYFPNNETTLKAGFELLWLDENAYPADSSFYVGQRQKYTLGCGVTQALRENVKGSLDIKGFYIDDEKNWYHPEEDYAYKGFSIAGNLYFSF